MNRIYQNADYINSSEAISDFICLGNSQVIIPFYNLALMEYNPINQRPSFLKYAFYILEGVQNIIVRSESTQFEIRNINYIENCKKEYLIVGGSSAGMKGADIEINYNNNMLYIPLESELSSSRFEHFIISDNLPDEIINRIGDNYYKIII